MPHDPRPRDFVLLRVGHNRRHPARVIDMPMRINRGVHPIRRELPNQLHRSVLVEISAGIDQHQTFAGLARRNIREPPIEHHPVGDLLILTSGHKRMELARSNRPSEHLLSLIFYRTHIFLTAVRQRHFPSEGTRTLLTNTSNRRSAASFFSPTPRKRETHGG